MATSAAPALQPAARPAVIPWTQASLFIARSERPTSDTVVMANPSSDSPNPAQHGARSDLFAPVSTRNRPCRTAARDGADWRGWPQVGTGNCRRDRRAEGDGKIKAGKIGGAGGRERGGQKG